MSHVKSDQHDILSLKPVNLIIGYIYLNFALNQNLKNKNKVVYILNLFQMSCRIGQKIYNQSTKVLCTCSKCQKEDTERNIGLLISKSTRTRHCKKDHEQKEFSSLSLSSSSDSSSILGNTFVTNIKRYAL